MVTRPALTSAVVEARTEIKSSRRFQEWRPPYYRSAEPVNADNPAEERHYSRRQIAEKWGVSEDTVTTVFESEPGVLWIMKPAKHKRRYRTMRVPHSVLLRVHRRLTNGRG
jgi:hypothetical protein